MNTAAAAYDSFLAQDAVIDAQEFLLAFPVGSNPQGNDMERAMAIEAALKSFNSGRIWWEKELN